MEEQPALFTRGTTRRRHRRNDDIVTTSEGASAQDIIGEWITMLNNELGVPPAPERITARLAKEVRSLIVQGYAEMHIKWGLAFWTLEFMDDTHISPERLPRICWRYVMETSQQAGRWRHSMQDRWRGLYRSPTGHGKETKAERDANTATALTNWAAQRRGDYDAPGA